MPNDLFSYFSNQAFGISNQETPEQKESLRELNRTLSYSLNDYQAVQDSKEKANKERNFNVNSITALSLQAGKDESYASDLYNRIQSVQTNDEFNVLAKELQGLKEAGRDNKYLFDQVEYIENFGQGLGFYAGNYIDTDLWKQENRAKNLLKNDKLDFETISKVSTPNELYGYASSYLNQKRGIEAAKSLDVAKLVQDINNVTNITTDKNAFNPYLSNVLEDKFNTVGSEFYREPDPDANRIDTYKGREFDWSKMENVEGSQAYLDSYRKALRDKVNQSPTNKDDNYFKYDLEKEHLSKSKYALSLAIQDLNSTLNNLKDPEDTEYKAISNQRDEYLKALNIIGSRESNLEKLYGIEKGATSGGFRSFIDRLEAWAYGLSKTGTGYIPDGTREAERQLSRRSFYTPEVVAYDKFGNAVMSSDFLINSDNGNEYNWSGLFESGMTITGDMLPILVESALLRRGLASMGGLGVYDKLNKIKAPVIGELQLADRLSTLTLVTANTYPKMVEEEKKWGGNYKSRAWAHALNEGLTEGIGFPDVGGLKVKGYTRTLSGSTRTAAGLELTRSQLMANYVRGGADFLKNVGKFNLLESFEEEMALFGEYLISNHIYDEEYDAIGREKTKFDSDAVLETLGESFKAGLLYSGLNAGMRHYAITRRDYLQNQSNYEAANNPELFRAQLKKEFDEGAITEKEFRDGIYRIEELKTIYEDIPVLEKMASLPNFLNDEDTRFSLFTNAVKRNDLLKIDFANMTEEQVAELAAHKGASKAVQRAQEQYDAVKAQLAILTTKIQDETATPEDVANHTRLTELGQFLDKERKINVNETDLTPEFIESLRAQNLILDSDLSFTEEDLNNIIKDIETDIIRTEQRADKYANMSREQKDEIINNLYNEKINAVKEETNPEAIVESYSNLKNDIDEIEKLRSKKYESALRRKKELFNAYAERFEELTGKSAEQEYSKFEEELANTDIQMFLEKVDVKGLIEFIRKVEFNKNHINQDLYNILQENFNLSMADMIVKLRDSRNQNGDLTRIFEGLVALDRGVYFNIDQLNEYLKLNDNIAVNVTPEEFESLRNEYITKRGIQRSQSLAETGTYDNSDAAQSNPSTDPTEQRDDLVDLSIQASQADNTTDESGNSEKKDIQKEYYDRITANKTPEQIAEILRNRVNVHFNPNSARARKLKQILNNYLANKDRSAFTDELNEVKAGIAAEIATIESTNPNSPRISSLQEALAELELWQKTANKVVLKNPTTDFNTTATTEEVPSTEEAAEDESEDRPPVSEEAREQKVPDNITAGLQKLDAIMNARRARLLELTSPARTAGIEVNAQNELSTDPAVVRRVKFLEKLAEEPFKAKVLNRRQFLREVLSNRFPKESDQQIEERLKVISNFFETSAANLLGLKFKQLSEEEKVTFLQPITDMLGENFFDEGQIDFFLRNKGKGLVNQPDVLITVANEKGKIVYDEGGYPLELNFTAEQSAEGRKNSNWKKVPWRNSRRVEREGTELGVTEEEVLTTYGPAYDARNNLIDYLKENDDADVVLDADVSEGVLLPRTNYMAVQDVPGVSETASLNDFQIAQNPSESIFDKYFKFQLGRLYYNNNGNPVILNNRKISEAEAVAIAELVYSNNTDLISPAQLDAFLRTVINQIDKDNRLMFFEGERYRSVEGQESLDHLIKPKRVTTDKDGKRKFKPLSKEEFIKTLQDHYYKVDADYLLGGEKFGNKIPFISLNEAGEIEIGQESYLDYIKRTHELPVDKDNKVTSMVNKSLYLDLEAIDKINKVKNIKAAAIPPSKIKQKAEEQESSEAPVDQAQKVANTERRRQEKFNAQYRAMNSEQVLDNQGDPVYDESRGISANGLATLTDKKWGHGHNRTSGLNSLKVLESLLDGSDFSGMFGEIKRDANRTLPYTTWESGTFIIASNNSNPTSNNKLNLNEIEIILNAGLSPFAQELANKYPNVVFKDFNGQQYNAESAPEVVTDLEAPVDQAQQKTLFRIFEKAFYEGNDKRFNNISDEVLASLSPATRQYLVDLYEAIKPYNEKYQRLGKVTDENNKEIVTDEQKIKYVTSAYFSGKGRGSQLGTSISPKFTDLVFPTPSRQVLENINKSFGAKLTTQELNSVGLPTSTDAKSDIERRRKLSVIKELDTGVSDNQTNATQPEPGYSVTYYLPEGKTTDGRDISKIPQGSIERYTTETRVFYGFEEAKQEALDWINSKYNEELVGFESPTETKKSTTLKPKIQDKFAVVPHAEFADYLGKLPRMKELEYDELVAQIEANPTSVTDVQVLIPNEQGEIIGQAYERVIDNPDFELVLLFVTDKNGKTKRVLARRLTPTQAAALPDNSVVIGSVIVDKSDSREADYNLVRVAREDWKSEEAVPAAKKKTPLSFEEMENSVTDEALDENQKQQGKENKEACKTGSGRKAAMKSGRRSGPGL